MRFLLRVDSHARNHSAHPQAQSRVAALRAYPCSGALRACSAAARSARVSGRYMPPILRNSKTSSAVMKPPGSCAASARTSLSCLIVRLCSRIRSSCSAVGRSGLRAAVPFINLRSRTGAGSTGRTAFTTTTGHVHRGAALELRCSRVWSCRGRRQRHSVCQTRATTSGQL